MIFYGEYNCKMIFYVFPASHLSVFLFIRVTSNCQFLHLDIHYQQLQAGFLQVWTVMFPDSLMFFFYYYKLCEANSNMCVV